MRRSRPTELPLPSVELIQRVTGSSDTNWFVESGRQSIEDLRRGLAAIGTRFEEHLSILDFGCGCGRVLRWLRDAAPDAEMHGVDIDAEAIAWTQAHLSSIATLAIDTLPPMPYADDSFDLVVNHSVFSHLPEDYQDSWLAELARVTKPGAPILLSVHGEHAFSELRVMWTEAGATPPDEFLRSFYRKGFLYLPEDSWTGGPFPDFYHSTFHAPWYVFDHWAKFLHVRAYITRGALGYQDLVVLSSP